MARTRCGRSQWSRLCVQSKTSGIRLSIGLAVQQREVSSTLYKGLEHTTRRFPTFHRRRAWTCCTCISLARMVGRLLEWLHSLGRMVTRLSWLHRIKQRCLRQTSKLVYSCRTSSWLAARGAGYWRRLCETYKCGLIFSKYPLGRWLSEAKTSPGYALQLNVRRSASPPDQDLLYLKLCQQICHARCSSRVRRSFRPQRTRNMSLGPNIA